MINFGQKKKEGFDPIGFFPTLQAAIRAGGLRHETLSVAIPFAAKDKVEIPNRRQIMLSDNKSHIVSWEAPLMTELFRTDIMPPSLEQFPPEYLLFFAFIEEQLCGFCNTIGDRRDKEMEEIYVAMKKRPDGKSMGQVHDVVWQLTAVAMALRPTSRLEYEAIMGRLARSAGTFAMGAGSRNYLTSLHLMFAKKQIPPRAL